MDAKWKIEFVTFLLLFTLVYSDSPSVEDYIRQHGYPVESHEIMTADGYILTYHRLPHGRNSVSGGGPPVLLQHGLTGASAVWVLSDNALAYTLADAGFDVWLGNVRGNTYSRKHTTLDPDKADFWDFSWHEMGHYDLPASIDYILNVTKRQDLVYIGHSMGTTMFFVLGATRPEYMAKVKAAVLMAPVAFPWNIKSRVSKFAGALSPLLNAVATTIGYNEVLRSSKALIILEKFLCSFTWIKKLIHEEVAEWLKSNVNVCEEVMRWIGGFSLEELERTHLPSVLQFVPAGTSLKCLKHFRQISEEKEFRNFNYEGWKYSDLLTLRYWKSLIKGNYKTNYNVYGSSTPPVYDLNKVTCPLYIYYAMNDWQAVPKDVLYTAKQLPNVKEVHKIQDNNFNHLDFMWAADAKKLLYDDVIEKLKRIV